MSRIPALRRDELDHAQGLLYDAIVGARTSGTVGALSLTDAEGHLAGPFNAMLLNPDLGMALQELGTAIRNRGVLSPRCRELAVLVVAAHWKSAFELDAHTAIGAHVGLTDGEMAALRVGGPVQLSDDEEAAVVAVTRTLANIGDVSDADYQTAAATLSPAKLFELTTLVGYYSLLALQMRVFGIDAQS